MNIEDILKVANNAINEEANKKYASNLAEFTTQAAIIGSKDDPIIRYYINESPRDIKFSHGVKDGFINLLDDDSLISKAIHDAVWNEFDDYRYWAQGAADFDYANSPVDDD